MSSSQPPQPPQLSWQGKQLAASIRKRKRQQNKGEIPNKPRLWPSGKELKVAEVLVEMSKSKGGYKKKTVRRRNKRKGNKRTKKHRKSTRK